MVVPVHTCSVRGLGTGGRGRGVGGGVPRELWSLFGCDCTPQEYDVREREGGGAVGVPD